jgi:hypothetical protein
LVEAKVPTVEQKDSSVIPERKIEVIEEVPVLIP